MSLKEKSAIIYKKMKSIIIANWKCNPCSLTKARQLFSKINKGVEGAEAKVVICPPSAFLNAIPEKPNFSLGCQNCFYKEGAFTGEVSFSMAKSLKCRYAIIGHSERRSIFSEDDEMINKKVIASLEQGITPILCIGENKSEREEGRTFEILGEQLSSDLEGLSSDDASKIIIAYEPIWAIGTGNFAKKEEVAAVKEFIDKLLRESYGALSEKIRIIYGGSVNSSNIADYIFGAGMNGALVGGASLNAKEFLGIIKNLRLQSNQ